MDWIRTLTLNKVLGILAAIAAVLGVITYFVLFYGGGNYVVMSPLPMGGNSGFGNSTTTASSTASSTLAGGAAASSTASSTSASGQPQEYSSFYAAPPISWTEGGDTLAITGASLSGSQLTLEVTVQMGTVPECVPMNLRLVTDEKGDLAAPLTTQFAFPDSNSCQGAPGATYADQQVVFTVDPSSMPLNFTTGGTSNEYFQLSTAASGSIEIALPSTNG